MSAKSFIVASVIAMVVAAAPCEVSTKRDQNAPPAAKAHSIAVEGTAADYMFIRQYFCGASDSTCEECELRNSIITHKCLEVEGTTKSFEARCNGTITFMNYDTPDCTGTPQITYEPTHVCTLKDGEYASSNCFSPCN